MQPRTGRAHSPLVILLPALGWFAPTHVESFSFFYHGSKADTIALPTASSCAQRSEPQRLPGISILGRRSRVMSRASASSLASGDRGRSGDGSHSALTRRLSSETATEQETSSVRRLQKNGGETETVTPSTSRTKPKVLGPRRIGDLEDEGFSGTRVGFHTLKEYEVPQDAPTNLPEGEERGYPMLLYQFMHAQYPDDFPSQSSSRKAVRRKELLLNGEEIRNDSKVQPGDVITSQKRVQPGLFPQGKPSCKLPVLWEDDFIAVVVKPPGVAVHGDTGPDGPGPGGRRSVRQSLPYILTPTKSLDRPLHRPLHCHRLDKPTGGLLVCAKTRPALSGMNDAFEKRLVSKRYVALVSGMLEGSGSIVTALDDKPCVTNFRARDEPVRSLRTDYITTVDLWPVTGRFHQLRRHLASIGNPILGDDRYSDEDLSSTPRQRQGGLFLQAIGLTFPHPITGEELRFSIPEPAKFGRWRERENRRWIEHHEAETNADQGDVSVNQGMDENVPGADTPRSPNAVPEVEGLNIQERDGFRYYQYDWGVVGGPPSPLSLEGIDETVDDP